MLVATFFAISYTVVINTVRTTIHSKGVEFEIMKLVGASDKYVKTPLIRQGMLFGAVASFIAGLLLFIVGLILHFNGSFKNGFSFGFLPTSHVSPLIFSIVLFILLVASGIGLGYLSSASAVKKYLKY